MCEPVRTCDSLLNPLALLQIHWHELPDNHSRHCMQKRQICALTIAVVAGWAALFAKDTEWPLTIDTPKGKITVYQPQPDAFKHDVLDARAAVSFTAAGTTNPQFGAVWMTTRVLVDREERIYTAQDLKITQIRFPAASTEQVALIKSALETAAQGAVFTGSLDRLMTSLEHAEQEQSSARGLNTAPPKIIFSEVPAVLIPIDGEPQLRSTSVEGVQRVINTPVALLYSTETQKYYLTDGGTWVSATAVMGPYELDKRPPQNIVSSTPPDTSKNAKPDITNAQIIVSMEPSELVLTDGTPAFAPLTGTNLLYVKNTDRDMFMDINSQTYYILLAGRWYQSTSLSGTWTYVAADSLPSDFSKIPPQSDVGDARTFVAGTVEAKEAILDASIPQTSAVARNDTSLIVFYDGEPQFEPIKGTEMSYAVNTEYSVLLIDGRYYCCHQAVWYEAPGPKGPWTVCTEVPDEVYEQPATSPTYNTKYVYVYQTTPSVVYVGYLPGYTGCYVYGPTVVYGTGWYYPPYYGAHYFPRPVTYGFAVSYNPWTGWRCTFGWSVGFVHYGVSFHSYYRPPYYRPPYHGGGWYGPGGYRPPPPGYRPGYRPPPPRPVPHASTRPAQGGSNIYGKAGNRARSANISTLPAPEQPKASRGGNNNVYVDRDGNVFRRDNKGQWQQRDGNTWTQPAGQQAPAGTRPADGQRTLGTPQTSPSQPQTRPSQPQTKPSQPSYSSRDNLDRDASSRQRGVQRQQDYRQQSSSGSYSRGSGSMRGGGGRRR